jgi:hypothetical protein
MRRDERGGRTVTKDGILILTNKKNTKKTKTAEHKETGAVNETGNVTRRNNDVDNSGLREYYERTLNGNNGLTKSKFTGDSNEHR